MNISYKYLSLQEIGKRTNQEDSIYPALGQQISDDGLFILCDGIGGHACGEVASQIVCEAMSSYILENQDSDFESALAAAYDALDAADTSSDKKMGTTLTFVKFEDDSCIVAHIGDSRVYHIRPSEKRILYVTRDHSLVNDLIACGELTEEEAKRSKQKNVITRAMQPHQPKRTKADVAILTDIKPGDYFYMCSDGMLEISENEDIVNVLSMNVSDEEKLEIFRGVTADNSDNHTAHLIHITKVQKAASDMKIVTPLKRNKKPVTFLAAIVAVLLLGLVGCCFIKKYDPETGQRVPIIKMFQDSTALKLGDRETLEVSESSKVPETPEVSKTQEALEDRSVEPEIEVQESADHIDSSEKIENPALIESSDTTEITDVIDEVKHN